MEEWKDVVGYEGIYQVSSYGRVKKNNGKELSQRKDQDGYLIVTLYKGGIRADYKAHRLVGMAFIDNPNNYPVINHKDENPSNNHVENLEWCTVKYNCNYGNRNKKLSEALKRCSHAHVQGERNYFYGKHFLRGLHPQAKKVAKLDSQGNILAVFDCTIDAAENVGCNPTAISMACNGKRNKIKGFQWKHLNEDEVDKLKK